MLAIIDWFQWYQIAFSCWSECLLEISFYVFHISKLCVRYIYNLGACDLIVKTTRADRGTVVGFVYEIECKQFPHKHPTVEDVRRAHSVVVCRYRDFAVLVKTNNKNFIVPVRVLLTWLSLWSFLKHFFFVCFGIWIIVGIHNEMFGLYYSCETHRMWLLAVFYICTLQLGFSISSESGTMMSFIISTKFECTSDTEMYQSIAALNEYAHVISWSKNIQISLEWYTFVLYVFNNILVSISYSNVCLV